MNEEILKKAIEKAEKNGWSGAYPTSIYLNWIDNPEEDYGRFMDMESKESILFDHDFAKAFWGEELVDDAGELLGDSAPDGYDYYMWKYHLQQLALAEDRLAYVAQFLDKEHYGASKGDPVWTQD